MKTGFHFLSRLGLGLAICLSIGCASEKEKEARRDNAFDLEGNYVTSKAQGSELDMSIKIVNGGSRSDIHAEVVRANSIEANETDFLNSFGIDASKVASYFGNTLRLGSTENKDHLDGGKNISTDFGDSSQFYICTQSYQYDDKRSLYYCLSGNISRADYRLKGELSLHLTTKIEKKDEKGKVSTEFKFDQTKLSYVATPPYGYAKQYLATWTGTLVRGWNSPTLNINGNQMLTLRALNDQEFEVVPSMNTVLVDGIPYDYVEQKFSSKLLTETNVPLIEVVFRKRSSEDRLVFVGQIYSLGRFNGAFVLVRGTQEDQIASITLTRQ